ncbi:MAG: type II secretion system protein [Victivallales bacterium]|nr:type II secretion system protein [Victivallales bacterium]MBT7162647.1 type II secretion system protein [Victivallales bacterium]MBT7303051.1 type II secretion system protein [Victivallales bacterium]
MIRRRRFTLLELIVAVAVFSLVMTVLYGFGRQVTVAWERMRRDQRAMARLMSLDRALDGILTNAVPFLWPEPDADVGSSEKLVFEGREDSLLLATLHRVSTEGTDGAIRFVRLALRDGDLVAEYAPRPFWDWNETGDGGETSVLARDVSNVSFLYADFLPDRDAAWEDRLEWFSEWDLDEDKPRQEIPLAIMVTVTWQNGNVESWLRRTAGQGYRERFGKWAPRKE